MIGKNIYIEKKRCLHGFILWIFVCAVIITSSFALDSRAALQSEQPIKYELKLKGEDIRLLVLQSGNKKQTFEEPGKSIMLEPGTYKISQLLLKSGLVHFPSGGGTRLGPIQVGPGGPPILKAGGPLEQRIIVQRKGQLLTMAYHLVGIAGEWYRNDRRYPPAFAVYKGDKKIASGKFPFG